MIVEYVKSCECKGAMASTNEFKIMHASNKLTVSFDGAPKCHGCGKRWKRFISVASLPGDMKDVTRESD